MAKPDRLSIVRNRIGANVRRGREREKLTQAQLATRADIEPQYLQRIEAGSASPSLALLVRLAEALGLSEASLFKAARSKPRRPGRPKGRAG